MLLHRLDTGLRGAIDQEGAKEKPVAERARPQDHVTRWDLSLVAGRQNEVLSAFAPILAGNAHIRDPAIPEIVHAAQDLGRNLHDQRTFLRVEPDEVVDGVVVRRELHRPGIDEVFPDDIGLVVRPELTERVAHASLIHDRDRHEVSLQGARTIEVVVDFLDGVCLGIAVAQIQGADGAFDLVRHGDARGDGRRELELRIRGRSNRRLPEGST